MKKNLAEELLRSIILYEKDILQRTEFHFNKGLGKLKEAIDLDYIRHFKVSYKVSSLSEILCY